MLSTNQENCWIQTYSGKSFNFFSFTEEDICIEDIAIALSRIPRFNGHSIKPYFVAQHSVIVSYQFENNDTEGQKWGLLHDASEAYVSDMVSPLKANFPEYSELEKKLQKTIAAKFNLVWPMPGCITYADLEALATEKRDLMGPEPKPWRALPDPIPKTIVALSSEDSYKLFMCRYSTLFGG